MKNILTIVCVLALVSLSARVRAADVGITGITTVPGQSGDLGYEIRITADGEPQEVPGSNPKQYKSKLKVKVKLKPSAKGPSLLFYICMMFQLKKGEGDLAMSKERPRQTLAETDCTVGGTATKCWCCRPATDGTNGTSDERVSERQAYHLGCRRIDLNPNTSKHPKDKNGSFIVFDESVDLILSKKIRPQDIESVYWDTFLGAKEHEDARLWSPCKGSGANAPTPTVPNNYDPSNTCPGVVGQGSAMGPADNPGRISGVGGFGAINIWAGAFRPVGAGQWIWGGIKTGIIGSLLIFPPTTIIGGAIGAGANAGTLSHGQSVEELPDEISMAPKETQPYGAACDGQSSFCWVASVPLGNFFTMGLPGEYPAVFNGNYVGLKNATVRVIIPGQTDHLYTSDSSGRVSIHEEHVISSHKANDQDMIVMVISPTNLAEGETQRVDGDVTARIGNPLWNVDEFMHRVALEGTIRSPEREKKTRLMFRGRLLIGPSVPLVANPGAEGSIGVELGVLPIPNLVVALMFQPIFNQFGASFLAGAGVGYDLHIFKRAPNLSIEPQLFVGYAPGLATAGAVTTTTHSGFVLPQVALTYSFPRQHVQIGAVPLSFPVIFSSAGASAFYQFTIFAGFVLP